jgi:polysaccharide export outer membrane protein
LTNSENSFFLKYAVLFLLSFFLLIPLSHSAVTAKTLKHDLAYYHKIAKEKHLSSNDRYFILLRISTKYDGTKVDLTALHAEMKKLKPSGKKTNTPITAHKALATQQHAVTVAAVPPAGTQAGQGEINSAPEKPLGQMPAVNIVSVMPVHQDSATPSVPLAIDKPYDKTSTHPSDKSLTPPENYVIETGDILTIAVFPTEELSREIAVQTDGSIPFPLIGSIQAKGLTTKQLEKSLAKKLGRYVSNPQISVIVKQFSHHQVLITGEVHSVGAFNYRENIHLMEFISAAGGFTDVANRKEIKIYRGPPENRKTFTIDVEDIIRTGDFSKDFLLEPGDIIEVPKGQSRISLLGEIRSPGYYDFHVNMRLVDLISQAGGFTDNANISNVTIIHTEASGLRRTVKVNLKKILSGTQNDVEIQTGDTVYLPRKALASSNLFATSILPWITLISLVIVIRGGV